jgi:UDP-glucose 4-epimerase
MARIFVTGSAGCVGSHRAETLASAGHEGIVLDNWTVGRRDCVRWEPLIEGDIRHSLDAIFNRRRDGPPIRRSCSPTLGWRTSCPAGPQ